MRKLLSPFIGLLLAANMTFADEIVLNQDVPERYVVEKGDTLWDISALFLRDPWKWPEVWSYNQNIANPHLIYPGDMIRLVYIDGQPKLGAIRADQANNRASDGTIVLMPKAIRTQIDNAIPTIPREHIESFLNKNQIIDAGDLQGKPHIVASKDGRLVLGGGDTVYVAGAIDPNYSRYMVYREAKLHKDPDTKEKLGLEITALGIANYENSEANVHRFTLNKTQYNIKAGDYLYPITNEYSEPMYAPKAPASEINARILSVSRGVSAIGQYDVVLLSKGENQGLKSGDLLEIQQAAKIVKDPVTGKKVTLPTEEAGLAMIFDVNAKTSYALIMHAVDTMKVGDLAVNP